MRTDFPVQCCRCRNKHMESERDEKRNRNLWTTSICPRCGAESFYDMTPLIAWCWASGRIDVGAEMPQNSADGSGAIQIASGPKSQLMLALGRFAIQGCDSHFYVPGVSEKKTQREAGDALALWLSDCKKVASRRNAMKEVVFNSLVEGV